MTAEEARALVGGQATGSLTAVNDHRITLGDALVAPRMISVIVRQVKNGLVKDENLSVWLVVKKTGLTGTRLSSATTDCSLVLRLMGFRMTSFRYWPDGMAT